MPKLCQFYQSINYQYFNETLERNTVKNFDSVCKLFRHFTTFVCEELSFHTQHKHRTMKKGNILVVDDNRAIRTSLELLLPLHFERVITLPSPKELHDTLRRNPDLDVVLLDMNFHAGINTGGEGLYWLREIKKIRPTLSVVLFTAYGDIELAVTAIKDGATDFIEKPWDNNKLLITLQNAVQLSRNSQKINALKSLKQEKSEMFWGESPAMQALRAMVEKVAPTDANILILGENGTGKEMLAREVHLLSRRSEEQLVSVDMGAVTETLFESELFGHSKGAFTDAKSERAGKFEVASGGTLFLDEIGNLPLHLQSKLLVAIQSRAVVRLGENTPRPIDIRLITATNTNLEAAIAEDRFREDLYYRINTFVIELPPLRERGDDIVELASLFLVRYAKKYGKSCSSFALSAIEKMKNHIWSGNIRELQHTIEKAVILSDKNEIRSDDLLLTKSNSGGNSGAFATGAMTIEQMERTMIESTIRACGGNMSDVADKLGITRQTLYNKLKKYSL